VNWIVGTAGICIWVAYLACGVLIARACAAGSAGTLVLYWFLPFIVAVICVSSFYPLMGTALSLKVWPSLIVALASVGYGYQWMVQMYIFKCGACGSTFSTYRVAWRRGIYTCPNCSRQYFKGVPGPG
jgi:hypothetical protein